MLNKSMLVVSGTVAAVSVIGTIGISKAIKGINKITEQKKKEETFFNILKECIEEETDYCINVGIIDKSLREKVIKQIFKDAKEMVKKSDTNEVFNMSPDEQRIQLKEGLKQSRSAYAMYGLFA